MDDVNRIARERVREAEAAMQEVVDFEVLRRPNTKELIQEAMPFAQELPPQGRERLAQWAQETYGDAAKFIFPYIGIEEEANGQA